MKRHKHAEILPSSYNFRDMFVHAMITRFKTFQQTGKGLENLKEWRKCISRLPIYHLLFLFVDLLGKIIAWQPKNIFSSRRTPWKMVTVKEVLLIAGPLPFVCLRLFWCYRVTALGKRSIILEHGDVYYWANNGFVYNARRKHNVLLDRALKNVLPSFGEVNKMFRASWFILHARSSWVSRGYIINYLKSFQPSFFLFYLATLD